MEGYWFSIVKEGANDVVVWGNNGALRARASGGHKNADVEQVSYEVARQKRVE